MRVQRRRSWSWWGICLFAFLATGAYIAFDVLDLDGSDLRGRPASGTVAAEPARSEPEGGLRLGPLPPDAPGLPPALLAHRVASLGHRAALYAATAVAVPRGDQFLARAHIGQQPRSDPQSSDPA